MIAIRNMVNLCISIDQSYFRWCSNWTIYVASKNRIESYSIETTNIY